VGSGWFGKQRDRSHSSITLFPEKDFNGRAWSMGSKSGSVHKSLVQIVGSIILIGKGEWTLVTTKLKHLCFSSDEVSACMLPSLGNAEHVMKVSQGCSKGSMSLRINPDYCFQHNSGRLHKLDGTEINGSFCTS